MRTGTVSKSLTRSAGCISAASRESAAARAASPIAMIRVNGRKGSVNFLSHFAQVQPSISSSFRIPPKGGFSLSPPRVVTRS